MLSMTSGSSMLAMTRTAAMLAGLDVDPEHALEPLCPSHRLALLGHGAVRIGFSPPPAPGRGDAGTVATVGREYAMKPREVDPGAGTATGTKRRRRPAVVYTPSRNSMW